MLLHNIAHLASENQSHGFKTAETMEQHENSTITARFRHFLIDVIRLRTFSARFQHVFSTISALRCFTLANSASCMKNAQSSSPTADLEVSSTLVKARPDLAA